MFTKFNNDNYKNELNLYKLPENFRVNWII